MMLSSIFTKSVRDHWRGMAIAFVAMMAMLLFAMSIYRNLDVNIYQGMPEALKAIMGIPEGANAGSLAVSVFLSGAGAWVLAGLTVAWGSSSIASEESNGTIGLLLGNPRSRTNMLVSKAGSMTLLMLLMIAASWVTTYLIATMLGVSLDSLKVEALSLHLLAIALFHGFLALALSAWTGNRGTAAGITTGVMIVSIFAVGLLPLIEGWENMAKIFPWYYLNAGEPLFNGINWAHIAILAGGSLLSGALGVAGINRRDLKGQNVGVTLLDRMRTYPLTRKIISRLAGSGRVSGIWVKTFSEHQTLLTITGYVMVLTGILIGVIYEFMPIETMKQLLENFPEAEVIFAAIGGGDFSTPAGFFQLEVFGLMAPAALLVVGIAVGGRALSGEESRNTMGLLLANPVPRYRIIIEKSLAMLICTFVTGAATFAGVAAGNLLGGLDVSYANLAAVCLLVTLLGTVFGALALAIDSAIGNGRAAAFGAIGVALASYLASSFLPLSPNLAGLAKWTPYYYYLGSDPINTGLNWVHAAVLAGLALGLIMVSIALFQRRDLRHSG